MRILIVDDSRATRMIVRSTVESLGLDDLEILEASDGEEALGRLAEAPSGVDLVLADWDMPRMDGLTFMKRLKASEEHQDVPVIMVTSQTQRDRVAEALQLGASDYVIKPFNSAALLQKIQPLIGTIQARKMNDTAVMLRDIVTAARAEKEKPFFRRLPAEIAQALTRRGAERAWAAGSTVMKAGEAADVLFILIGGELRPLPDDGTPPLREGDCVESRAFMSGERVARTWVARVDSTGLLVDRFVLADALRRHPQLSQYLRGLLSAPSAEPGTAGLAGALTDYPIEDVVQVLSITRKTGVLRLTKRERTAGISFEHGEVRHAWVDDHLGEEAFCRLLLWRDAHFVFESGTRMDRVTILRPVMTMLEEGARRRDETRVLRND